MINKNVRYFASFESLLFKAFREPPSVMYSYCLIRGCNIKLFYVISPKG